jgi:cation diffusion facilitator CzcD-associated flavoprotein CzcO
MGGIETDYLVVGAGAAGMAFVDALIADCDADVVMVDRRHRPAGHWNDAYPFVRLHGPSGPVRGQLTAAWQRHHRADRAQRRFLPEGERRRDLRLLRARA